MNRDSKTIYSLVKKRRHAASKMIPVCRKYWAATRCACDERVNTFSSVSQFGPAPKRMSFGRMWTSRRITMLCICSDWKALSGIKSIIFENGTQPQLSYDWANSRSTVFKSSVVQAAAFTLKFVSVAEHSSFASHVAGLSADIRRDLADWITLSHTKIREYQCNNRQVSISKYARTRIIHGFHGIH